jgi:hypothetical protein
MLQGREGADPACKLYCCGPEGEGNMYPGYPLPSQYQQRAQNGKENKDKVEDQDQICEMAIKHGP